MKLDRCSLSSCELLEADPAFAAYSIMSLSPCGGHLVMGNLSGSVKVLPLPYHGMLCPHKGKGRGLFQTLPSQTKPRDFSRK